MYLTRSSVRISSVSIDINDGHNFRRHLAYQGAVGHCHTLVLTANCDQNQHKSAVLIREPNNIVTDRILRNCMNM